jgi:hypothetical protein
MRSLLLAFVLFGILGATQAHAGTVEITSGGLPKDTGIGEFTLTVAIRNITPQQLAKGSDRDDVSKTFEIRFKDIDSNPIAFSAAEATATPVKFYAEKAGDVLESASVDDTSGQNRDLTYQIRIREAATGELSAKADKMKRISFAFKLGGETVVADTDKTLVQENYAINARVSFRDVLGSHKSLVASWDVEGSVATIGDDGKERAPGSVTVYVVDPDLLPEGTRFPGKVFATEAGKADVDAFCTFSAVRSEQVKNEAGCLSCDGANVYLNDAEIAKIPGVYVKTETASTGSATIGGLTNYSDESPKVYSVFMEYKPNGLQRSQCAIGIASPNYTLTELNGEKEAKVVDFRCFVATAAYGSPLHEDLDVFRRFRDETLLTSPLGRRGVELYYRTSPGLAGFISRHESLRDLVRGALSLLAEGLRRNGYEASGYASRFDPEPYYAAARQGSRP